MSLPPQKFREIVFQILFSRFFPGSDSDETALMLMGELKVTKKSVSLARQRVDAIEAKIGEIDRMITETSTEYAFERISNVEKAVLRLSLFEILWDTQVPPLVALAEGIRLTRKFGTPESATFVNAILDKVYRASISNQPASI